MRATRLRLVVSSAALLMLASCRTMPSAYPYDTLGIRGRFPYQTGVRGREYCRNLADQLHRQSTELTGAGIALLGGGAATTVLAAALPLIGGDAAKVAADVNATDLTDARAEVVVDKGFATAGILLAPVGVGLTAGGVYALSRSSDAANASGLANTAVYLQNDREAHQRCLDALNVYYLTRAEANSKLQGSITAAGSSGVAAATAARATTLAGDALDAVDEILAELRAEVDTLVGELNQLVADGKVSEIASKVGELRAVQDRLEALQGQAQGAIIELGRPVKPKLKLPELPDGPRL